MDVDTQATSSCPAGSDFEGAIDLDVPIGSAALRIRTLERDAGAVGSPQWSGELDPFPWYRSMLEAGPVHRDETVGLWMVFGYDEVERVLTDHQHFSSQFGNLGMQNVDPPRHRELRTLVTYAFTSKRVEGLRTRIEEIANGLLDTVVEQGEMDAITDYTQPLSTTVIADLLGVPMSDHAKFRRWTEEVSHGQVSFDETAGRPKPEAPRQMAAYFTEMIESRRSEPQKDLISDLLAARDDGRSLSAGDIFNFCVLLLVAGNETTGNLIGNALRAFNEHPDALDEIRANPDLMAPALEEVLRYYGSIQSMMRIASVDIELGGQTIRKGDTVIAWIGAANRDPKHFDNPEVFDIHRSPNRHIAFGHGIHFCLGAPLARLEGRVALDALVTRLPDIRIGKGIELEPLNSRVIYGVRSLPIRFAPAPVVSA